MVGLPIQLASGRVILDRRLGSGASGEVWAVWVNRGGSGDTQMALKVGRPELSKFLASEAERLTLACSVGLPALRDLGRLAQSGLPRADWHNAPYLLMTLLPGRRLSQLIDEQLPAEMRVQLALAVARDVGRALADLHEANVAHGDVKPDNILVEQGEASTSGWRCTLCDLGLAAVGEQWTGATPKYLPPEFHNPELGPSSSSARDLWALGVTLLEVLKFDNVEAPGLRELPSMLRTLLTALSAPTAAARPRARWVSETAGARTLPMEHALTIKRHYLATHTEFLRRVGEGPGFDVPLLGVARDWLFEVAELISRIPILRFDVRAAQTTTPRAVALPLTADQRNRFLVGLCGLAAIDFPQTTQLTDDELLARLLAASKSRGPEAFTFDLFNEPAPAWLSERSQDLGREPRVPPNDLVALALELGSERPDATTITAAEEAALSGRAPLTFSLTLSQVLKRQGELGRARAVLLAYPDSRARVALAGVLARSGGVDEALTICDGYLTDSTPGVAAAASALKARLHLSRGELEAAGASVRQPSNDPQILEALASIALSHHELLRARELLLQAQGLRCDSEQRARLHALLAHLEHQQGAYEAAFQSYVRAATDARRAGAILEEATYLVGVAGTAAHLAKTADALSALRRADLLFEVIRNPAAQARAALNRASTLVIVGATAEAMTAAEEAALQAAQLNDTRCEAWAHVLLASHGDRHLAQDHLARARSLLAEPQLKDKLRIEACALYVHSVNDGSLESWDDLAAACTDAEVQLEWWTARARQLTREGASNVPSASERVLSALSRLMSQELPIDATGQAYAAGAELAALMGDGDRSLQFIALARDAQQKIIDGAPHALKLSARQLSWAKWLNRHSTESPLRAEQIGEIERLVKDLADRSRLRAVLDRSLDALIRWTGVERGLLLMNAPGGKLVPRAARNLARQQLSAEHQELSQTLARRALETGDCVVAVDASGELPSLHRSVHALKLRSVLAVPLIARGDTVGVVYLDDRMRRGAFGSNELAWVRLVGTIAAVAIAEARDQAQLRRAVRRATRAEQRLASHLASTKNQLDEANVALATRIPTARHGLIGTSPPMLALYHLIDRVGASQIPVLIFGESGTGKELVARALHRVSPRHDKPFVSENCGAIPEPLLESILFGHKRGAFTGAVQNHVGLFETANGGTLFLDELGEMSLPMQAKLLRVLESGELRRVGDDRVLKVDVRVFGASHRNLEQMVSEGRFREDLYYRLNVITVRLPPLRERATDIPDLVRHFLRVARKGRPLAIEPDAMAALQAFGWPGNVRQLENELRRASVLADNCIGSEHLSPVVTAAVTVNPASLTHLSLHEHVARLETQLIERALREASGNQSRAAEALGVSRFGLQKMLKRLGLSLPK